MNRKQFLLFLLLVFVSVFGLSLLWEFGIEDRLDIELIGVKTHETAAEQWKYVASISLFVLLSLIFPALAGLRLIKRQEQLLDEMQRVADVDYLTALYNRRKGQELLRNEVSRCQRYDCRFSVVMLDIDHFKRINDTHGHSAGDQVLSGIAELLRKGIREADLLSRWGGEEFLIICPETGLDGAAQLATKLRKRIETHSFPGVGHVTASFGVASYEPTDGTGDRLLSRADSALYIAKTSGRNRVDIADGVTGSGPGRTQRGNDAY